MRNFEEFLEQVYEPNFERLLIEAEFTEEEATKALSLAMDFHFDIEEFTAEIVDAHQSNTGIVKGECE